MVARRLANGWLYLLVHVALAAPLVYVVDFTQSYIFAQALLVKAIAGAVLVPMLWLWIWDSRTRPRWDMVSVGIVSVWSALFVSSVLGIDVLMSITGSWQRFGSFIDWSAVVIIFFALKTTLTSREQWRQYFRTAALVGTAAAVFGLAQLIPWLGLFFSGERIFGTLGNPAFFSSFLLLATGITLYQSATCRGAFRVSYLFAAALQILALFASGTRSAMLGLSVALLVLCACWLISRSKPRVTSSISRVNRSALFWSGLFVLCVCVWGVFALRQTDLTLVARTETLQTRMAAWQSAVQGFIERPVIGWGVGNYPVVFQRFYSPKLYTGIASSAWFDRSHNQFLDMLVEVGVVGFVAYLLLLTSPLRNIFSRPAAWHGRPDYILAAFLIGYYVYLFFFFHSIADILLFIAIAAFLSRRADASIIRDSQLIREMPMAVCLTAIVCSVGVSALVSVKPAVANYLIRQTSGVSGLSDRMEQYQRAWSLSTPGKLVVLADLYRSLEAVDTHEVTAVQARLQWMSWSHDVLRSHPYDGLLWLMRNSVATDLSAVDPAYVQDALTASSAVLSLMPRHPYAYQQRGQTYLLRAYTSASDSERLTYAQRAHDDFTRAYELAPAVDDHMFLREIAETLISGNTDQIVARLDATAGDLQPHNMQLVVETLYAVGAIQRLHELRNDLFGFIDTARTNNTRRADLEAQVRHIDALLATINHGVDR